MYSFTYAGTKHLIDTYSQEMIYSIEYVARSSHLSLPEKEAFLRTLSRNYGRTALCLSGGAGLAYYHVGVIKAMFENHALPNVITGSSAGSLLAALICTRTDQELIEDVFNPKVLQPQMTACKDTLLERLNNFYEIGAMFDGNRWFEETQTWVTKGTMTFLEAFQRTGRVLNIAVVSDESHAQPRLLNYITAPDIIIASAVVASSSIPGIILPAQLMQKNEKGEMFPFRGAGKYWRDGSLAADIPVASLKQLFNVQYTIVSQMNPHIVLFFYNSRGSIGEPSMHREGRGYRGGFIGAALVQHLLLDLQKWLSFLRDMDIMPRVKDSDISNIWLQKFHGDVTILPPPLSWTDLFTILSDPSLQRLEYQLQTGELVCWPKLRSIENRMRIEQSLIYWRQHLSGQHEADFEHAPPYV